MAYSKQSFLFKQILTSAEMNNVEDNIEDSRLETNTKAVFPQATAPTFWTKDTDQNDKALRIVSGTGGGAAGNVAFTTVFNAAANNTTENTTLNTTQIPGHTHVIQTEEGGTSGQVKSSGSADDGTDRTHATDSTGGGGSHNHTLALDLQYVDVIKCTKD